MTLTIYIADNCESCTSLIQKLDEFKSSRIGFEYKTINLSKARIVKAIIVPALFANNEPLAYGEEDILKIALSKSRHKYEI